MLEQCREVIEAAAPEQERADLLAVTQLLARLRYNDPRLLELLGGRAAMIESPLLDELVAEARTADLLRYLHGRFGPLPEELQAAVRSVEDSRRLDDLITAAAECDSLDAFRARVGS